MKNLEDRISKIEERNRKVESDKAWEVSKTRIIIIMVFTYVFATLYLILADTTNPFLGAIIPCSGFWFSMQSLNIIKKYWIKKNK